MGNPQPMRIMGDYYKRKDVGQISLGFKPVNHVAFDIRSFVLAILRDNQFDIRH